MGKLTLDRFLELRETKPASEFACGEVMEKPMPDGPHASIQAFLSVVLFQFLKGTGLGRVFPELRCIFGPPGGIRTYVPDLVVVTLDKLPIPRHLCTAPDVAIEVLSPDQHQPALLAKIQFYLQYGVRLVWVVDPATATVAVLAPDAEPIVLQRGDTLDGRDVLPGFSVPVADIFDQMPL